MGIIWYHAYRMGPPHSVQLPFKWVNSLVDGRYNKLVFMGPKKKPTKTSPGGKTPPCSHAQRKKKAAKMAHKIDYAPVHATTHGIKHPDQPGKLS